MRSPGDLIASKYRLQGLLARGGMGEVWTARNLSLDVPVAVKLMSAQALSSVEIVHRFEREARAAAQLRHPNVVTIFEHGVFEDVPFMVMELLEGQDLSARLKQRGRLSHAEALPIIAGVCKALRRAHEMHVVHRDLKPANVFLARQDDEEIVKVLDFGIAKIVGGEPGVEPTRAGSILGTPHYMAPEQARDIGVMIDHRADMWALGVIAFRMLTGRLPFTGSDPVMVLLQICTGRPPSASSIASDLEPDVDAFFARALARQAADRFQSARDFAEAFAALGGRPRVDPLGQSRSSAVSADAEVPSVQPDLGAALPEPDGRMSHPGGPSTAPRTADGSRRQFFRRSNVALEPPVSSVPRSSTSASEAAPVSSPLAPAPFPVVDRVVDGARTLPVLPSAAGRTVHAHSVPAAVVRPGSGTIPMIAGGGTVPLISATPPAPVSPPGPPGPVRTKEVAAMPLPEAGADARTVVRAPRRSTRGHTPSRRLLGLVVVILAILIGVVSWRALSVSRAPSGAEPDRPSAVPAG